MHVYKWIELSQRASLLQGNMKNTLYSSISPGRVIVLIPCIQRVSEAGL